MIPKPFDLRHLLLCALLLTGGAAPVLAQSGDEFSLDVSRLSSDTARFEFLLQGEATVGQMQTWLDIDGDSLTFHERTTFPGGFQNTTVAFLRGPRMRHVVQRGEARSVPTAIDVRYDEGVVRGLAVVPTASGADTITVDAAVPEGVIDDNVLRPLFPAMTLAPGMEFALPVFSSGKNRLSTHQFSVSRGESVEWNGEMIETLKVDSTDGDTALSYVVSRNAPHLVLQILPPGPIEVHRLPADHREDRGGR